MSEQSIERVWKALTAVDYWLRNDFVKMLEHSVAVDPSQWTIVHNAAKILNEEELSLPTDVYKLGMDVLQNSLQPNANQLLDHLRKLLEVRTNQDVAGETAVLEAVNAQIRKLVADYRARLLIVKAVIDGEEALLSIPDGLARVSLTTLRHLIAKGFNEDELKTFCFDLGVAYDDLPPAGKTTKAMELVAWFARRHDIDRLLTTGKQLRPDIVWDDALLNDENS